VTSTTASINERLTTAGSLSTDTQMKVPKQFYLSLAQGTKRHNSGTDSDDIDEQQDEQQSQVINGRSGHESDGSMGVTDRLSTTSQLALTQPEKKSGRTTIKPQQLEVCQ
jgi:hypothetical protein